MVGGGEGQERTNRGEKEEGEEVRSERVGKLLQKSR